MPLEVMVGLSPERARVLAADCNLCLDEGVVPVIALYRMRAGFLVTGNYVREQPYANLESRRTYDPGGFRCVCHAPVRGWVER